MVFLELVAFIPASRLAIFRIAREFRKDGCRILASAILTDLRRATFRLATAAMRMIIRQVEACITAKRRRLRTVKRADALIARPALTTFIAAVAAVLCIAHHRSAFAPAGNLAFRLASRFILDTSPSDTDFGRTAADIATAAMHRVTLQVIACIAAAARRADSTTPLTAT